MSFFSACDPPVLAGAPWAKTAERRLGPWVGRLMMRMMRAGIRGWSDPVFRLRERLGLPRGGEPVLEGQHSPHQVLALFTRVLAEPQPDWPPHTRVTGALLHDGTHGVGLDPELEAFLEAGDPPVVFTMGSSAPLAAGDLYARGVEAARLIGCRAVLLVGARRHSEFAALRDPAVLAVASAPHSALFPRSAAVVQHCGVGTLTQALRAGVPVLAVPFAHDQADNAYRAERLGVARILRPSAATGVRMASELRVLHEDGGYRDRVRRVSARVKAEDGLSTACEALEAMVSAPG
jgi:UDP:flavonoid glycosyltransferase YjiC (YdhE family)